MYRPTNRLTRPLHANFLNSTEHLTSHSAEIWLRGVEAWQNMLHQELFHALFDVRVPHDEGCKADCHAEGTVFPGSLGIRAQDVVDDGENWHESDFCSTLHQLDEEGCCRNERGIKVIAIIWEIVSLGYKWAHIGSSSPTCWRTRSMGSECQSSSLAGVKTI